MGYFFLSIALLAGATKGYCGKRTSGYTNRLSDAILVNIIRMVLCALIGGGLIFVSGTMDSLLPSASMLLICALSGISTSIFAVTWLVSVKKSAYMMLDIFLMMGLLIPLTASSLFFHEDIKATQWLGIAILFTSVVIMCSYNNSIKTKITPAAFLLLLLCGASNGVADFSQKLFTKLLPDSSTAAFNFYTYLFSALVLAVTYGFLPKADATSNKGNLKRIASYIPVMAICLFVNSYFKTLAAGTLSAVLLYPLSQGGSLILSTLMAAFFFREKLTVKAVIGICTAFAGLLIINLL